MRFNTLPRARQRWPLRWLQLCAWQDWTWQLKNRLTTVAQLERHIRLLQKVQQVHDDANEPDLFAESFEAGMLRVAKEFGLKPLPRNAEIGRAHVLTPVT